MVACRDQLNSGRSSPAPSPRFSFASPPRRRVILESALDLDGTPLKMLFGEDFLSVSKSSQRQQSLFAEPGGGGSLLG